MAAPVTKLGESRLESLLESAQLLNSSLKLDDLLRHLLRTIMGRLLVGRCIIAIRGEDEMRIEIGRGGSALKAGTAFNETAARQAGIEAFYPIGDADQPIGVLGLSHPARG